MTHPVIILEQRDHGCHGHEGREEHVGHEGQEA
jgi:hypothetical protein